MRPWMVVLAAAVFGLTGCGGDDATAPDQSLVDIGNQTGAPLDKGSGPPPCPFTTEQAAQFTGRPMRQEGDSCLWRGENGVGIVTVTTASRLAGETSYETKREMAEGRLGTAGDLGVGDSSYVAVGELEAEAVVINGKGSYTMTLSSLEGADYGEILRDMAAALPK